jgi:hypothetical protein
MRTFRRGGRRAARIFLPAVLSAVTLSACSPGYALPQADGQHSGIGGGQPTEPTAAPRPSNVPLATSAQRGGSGTVAAGGQDAVYNYGPTVMVDGGRTRMWWCSQYGSAPPPGDDILYGEAPTLDGPFTGPGGGIPAAVLSGSGSGHFDGSHTCDPSVIRVGATYYLYYTGAAGDHAFGNSIGVATSTDGLNWTRANGGRPIVDPSQDVHRDNVYGAGQPSAVFLDGWYYLMFTDTTGRATTPNGAGQFALRSKDPVFGSGVEALGEDGFEAVPGTNSPRAVSVVEAFSADLMWVEALDAFAVADETQGGTRITFFDRTFTAHPYQPIVVAGPWQEGPGLARRPDGHAPLAAVDPCAQVPFDLVRATVIGRATAPTDLRHYGVDVLGVNACADPARTLDVLDGLTAPSPDRTMDLLTHGKLVRVDRRSVATALAGQVLNTRPPQFDRLPVAATIPSGAQAVEAEGRGVGFVLNGTLWPLDSPTAATLNGSAVQTVSPVRWDAYPTGSSLVR